MVIIREVMRTKKEGGPSLVEATSLRRAFTFFTSPFRISLASSSSSSFAKGFLPIRIFCV